MITQSQTDFQRIETAILFLQANYRLQPSLDAVAKEVHLSPFHFQRLFKDWAGVTPKKFLQYITIEHAKKVLRSPATSLDEVALETGLSGTGRLHDLFVSIEAMTPGEYKNGGINLEINYSFDDTPFGRLLAASTKKGITYLAFSADDPKALMLLKKKFPNAVFRECSSDSFSNIFAVFNQNLRQQGSIQLHLKGTAFQLKVWETLLKIPAGQLSTYGEIAKTINHPNAARAVGSAIGDNPVAFLIPCHRVIQSTGLFGGYMWGAGRKAAIIGWEAAMLQTSEC